MPDDKIMVSVWDHDDLSVGNLQNVVSLQEEYGKWVMLDAKGEVKLPQIGTVKLQGLTVREATAFLEKTYSQFIQKPNVNIRVLNNQVTVLGEVRGQGNYIFSSDNIRLVDLIGKAQGFTDYAKTKRIQVIRGEKQLKVDLTNAYNVSNQEVMIYPGDVVYVPPAGNKNFDRFSMKLIPIASLITAVAIIYSVTGK
jgi:polysaccharide export outer membrane protein